MRKFFYGALLIVMLPSGAVSAQIATTRAAIVAVVNDEAITPYDLAVRTDFVLATTNIAHAPDSLARLKPQILRSLIDEHLQWQEARRHGIDVSPQEIALTIAGIEKQRQMPPGAIAAMLAGKRIPPETFHQQLRAQISWGKLLQQKVRGRIKITDDEVEQMAGRLAESSVEQELQVGLFLLPVDKPSRDDEVRKVAENIVLEARGGANFEELARQFAGGAVSENAKLSTFWVNPDELDPMIARALKGGTKGAISNPVRHANGYTIIKIYDTRDLPGQQPRDTEISVKEIVLELRSSLKDKAVELLQPIAQQVRANPGTCQEMSVPHQEDLDPAVVSVKKALLMKSALPAALTPFADGMKVGDVLPVEAEDRVTLYQICGVRENVSVRVDKERARTVVFQQRMELEAQRYMRNLRRDAFIDVRG